ncbi:universal stress protein [Aestuariispira insulae]|uniref:Nucleotide-binding universal stress UspA family protein n=1 Tax=Aestuariispira insulae TaxID=1461337 RepID=A0A3D9HKH0_9PROT|nr:universal stress protein [Aestuariispira insulae]RED49915.1 nucleotide-binding universal stress UspA family protein [Aestuariispira insulae]
MFKNILVATDGSVQAQKALETASDLAARYEAKLTIIHVMLFGEQPKALRHMAEVEHLSKLPVSTAISGDSLTAAVRADGEIADHRLDHEALHMLSERILEAAVRTAEKSGVANIATHSTDGDAASRILAYASQVDADLIVMGSRGLGRLKTLLVGSVSQKVSQMAECACMTVR